MDKKKFLIILIVVFAVLLIGVLACQPDAMYMAPGDQNTTMEIQVS
ncbi:hypothetical protein [Virgibacillus halodenitrificans]|nr:hypothetical protein [Virgibacillus halodenitrificans]